MSQHKQKEKHRNEKSALTKSVVISLGVFLVAWILYTAITSGRSEKGIRGTTGPQRQDDFVQNAPVNNVVMENGKQIITITTRGGYYPRMTQAKAGVPTIIRFATNNTYDCSAALIISDLGVQKMLPATGSTDIPAGSPKEGLLQGMCGMGMYSFAINFQK